MAARKGKRASPEAAFTDALRAALAEPDDPRPESKSGAATKLHRVAQTLVALAIDGNMTAIKEISDRLEGRPGTKPGGQSGEGEQGPVRVTVEWLKD